MVQVHGSGDGGRWWQPCPSLAFPHVRLGCRSLNSCGGCWQISSRVTSRTFCSMRGILCHMITWSLCSMNVSVSRPSLLHSFILLFIYSFSLFLLLAQLPYSSSCLTTIQHINVYHLLWQLILYCYHGIWSMFILELNTYAFIERTYK